MKVTARDFIHRPLAAFRRANLGEEVIITHRRYESHRFILTCEKGMLYEHKSRHTNQFKPTFPGDCIYIRNTKVLVDAIEEISDTESLVFGRDAHTLESIELEAFDE